MFGRIPAMLNVSRFFLHFGLLVVLLTSCAPTPATTNPNIVMTSAVETAFAEINIPTTSPTQEQTPQPSETPVPTATVPRTPPALPPVFTTTVLNPLDTPHEYIQDSCQYLKAKWNPNNAAPGTIVMVIMFHHIVKGVQTSNDPISIGAGDFKQLMNNLHEMGFEAINTTQLANFLYNNEKIPPRSVILIQDDRHAAENFNDWFRPYWQKWGWPVVNAWISLDGGNDINLTGNVALEREGWVDHQAHGVIHNIPMNDNSTDEYIRSELQGSIDVLQKYFSKTPIAIIWPTGDFGIRPVQMARQLGYKLGFTVNPRGPLMFNWIPLASANDPNRPSYIGEGYINDPLMVLPRYWDTDAGSHLDTVRQIGENAAAYAEQNKGTELEYYDIVCAPTLGPIASTP
jgi:hypothetical protein